MAENKVLVVGGGFSGLTAAVEAAETGSDVIIVEKNPYLGGRVTQLNKYFWKMCPPNCGLEIQYKRIKNNGQVTIMTMAEVEKISGFRRQLRGHHQDAAAVREREVHGLQQVHRGLPGRAVERLRLRHEQDQGRVSSPCAGVPAPVRHRRQGLQGLVLRQVRFGLRLRRDRSEHEA